MTTRRASPVRVIGPLAAQAEGFRVELIGRGYTPLSAVNQLRVMAHLSRWLTSQELRAEDLTGERVEAFLEARRTAGYTCWLSERGVSPLLGYLRAQGVVPMPVPVVARTPLEGLLVEYRAFLVDERGLASATVRNHDDVARLFLAECCRANRGELRLEDLTAAEVVAYVAAECPRRSVGSAKIVVTGLRSLLRFLHISGRLAAPLASAVPAVAGWRGGSLPRAFVRGHEKVLAGGQLRSPLVATRSPRWWPAEVPTPH